MKKKRYELELEELQLELAKLQETVARRKLRLAIVFEGRDAAGKGGMIKAIMTRMNPRIWRIAALPKPSDRESTQWYFQRYVAHLPAGGEITIFDRSWYNRAVIEPVMGFCTQDEYRQFLLDAPRFEKMLTDSGLILLKYWIQVSPEVQERRFQERACDPRKRWKLGALDLEGRKRWVDSARHRDAMFEATDTDWAPWWVVPGDDKRTARLNCIRHILAHTPYEYNEEAFRPIGLPKRQTAKQAGYVEKSLGELNVITDHYGASA